jgi:hypothetical protein
MSYSTRCVLALLLAAWSVGARAGWHAGTVRSLGFSYDSQTVVFTISGLTKSTCTCYATWPTDMCVHRSRQDFKEIYAFLLKARATGQTVQVNINETTCDVLALYESD